LSRPLQQLLVLPHPLDPHRQRVPVAVGGVGGGHGVGVPVALPLRRLALVPSFLADFDAVGDELDDVLVFGFGEPVRAVSAAHFVLLVRVLVGVLVLVHLLVLRRPPGLRDDPPVRLHFAQLVLVFGVYDFLAGGGLVDDLGAAADAHPAVARAVAHRLQQREPDVMPIPNRIQVTLTTSSTFIFIQSLRSKKYIKNIFFKKIHPLLWDTVFIIVPAFSIYPYLLLGARLPFSVVRFRDSVKFEHVYLFNR